MKNIFKFINLEKMFKVIILMEKYIKLFLPGFEPQILL